MDEATLDPEVFVAQACSLKTIHRLLAFVLRANIPQDLLEAGDGPAILEWIQAEARSVGPVFLQLIPTWRAFAMRLALGCRNAVPKGADNPRLEDACMAGGVVDEELAFHVRGQRGGAHPFSSDDAKRAVALGLAEGSGVRGACRLEYHIEVDTRVHWDAVWVGMCLLNSKRDLPDREGDGRSHLSVTTLNSTIAHAMIRSCQAKAGDVIVDPMAGCGTLPELGAATLSSIGSPCFCIGGDSAMVAIHKARANLCAARERGGGALVDLVHWDATKLPLRDGCVDRFLTDLPFGKRMGSKATNRTLYPHAVREMRRSLRDSTESCLVLLSSDRHALSSAIRNDGLETNQPWHVTLQRRVNVGGLDGMLMRVLRPPCNGRGWSQVEQQRRRGRGRAETMATEQLGCKDVKPTP